MKAQETENVASNLGEIDFDAENVSEVTRDYEINFEDLCPNVPTKGALECLKNFKLSQHVSQILEKPSLPSDFVAQLTDLTTCTTTKLPSTEITLNVYCYLEGVKEDILRVTKKIPNDSDGQRDILAVLRKASNNTDRQDVKDYFEDIRRQIVTGDESILELVGEVDEAKMEALEAARENQELIMTSSAPNPPPVRPEQ